MALVDLQAFILQCLANYNPTLDLSSGSPIDAQVIQPILQRLGTDPFSVDMATFIETRLLQEFPDLAIRGGDALTDLLEKPNIVLWDPIVREIQRVKSQLSFRDPTTLTTDDADALGANLFATRETGTISTGVARIYFASPQAISVTPSNFITSQTGLHFFPTAIQSISLTEMLLNLDGSLYYFDVNVQAEQPGVQYNIAANQLITIANITAATRVTNLRAFTAGLDAETAVQFVDRIQQSLTERSLVTLRGIGAIVPNAFSDITQLAVVGFNDPEMQRDIITGGGLGALRAAGVTAASAPDGENQVLTRRVTMESSDFPVGVNFLSIIGPTQVVPSGYMLTLYGAFGGTPPGVRDLSVLAVVDAYTLDLVDQVVFQSPSAEYAWGLRRQELTLSNIPGGIIFPDSPNGTVTIPNGQVHIGGCTDILVRGDTFNTSSLVIDNVVDDNPLLSGIDLSVINTNGQVSLNDIILGTSYALNDGTYIALQNSSIRGWTLQILEGPTAGSYRVIQVLQSSGGSPILTLSPSPPYAATSAFENLIWKLISVLSVNLIEPKETRISGSDMFSVQNFDELETTSGVDFTSFGVSPNDTLRILNGQDAGDFKVLQVTDPFFTRVQVDRPLRFSTSNLQYLIFRPNAEGGVTRPLIRVSSIDLLDTSGQPVGSTVPFASPIDARSSSFANVGAGVRASGRDGVLGICGVALAGSPPSANVSGLGLSFRYNSGLSGTLSVTFAASNPVALTDIVAEINTAVGTKLAVIIDGNRLGFTPIGFTELLGGSAVLALFGITPVAPFDAYLTSRDVQSTSIIAAFTQWSNLHPDVNYDVLQVLDGEQIGFYGNPTANAQPTPPFGSAAVDHALTVNHNFAPEAGIFIQFGSRSIGTVRFYFIEPTSIEFDTGTVVSVLDSSGAKLDFFTDPTVEAQFIPALPSGVKPEDGDTTLSTVVLTSLSTDFVQQGMQPGDVLVIDYIPITGTVNLPDPVTALQFQTLVLSISGGPDKTITFLTDSLAIPVGAVTRAGIATQINQAVGQTVCSIVPIGGGNYLQFDATLAITVRVTGTANVLLLGAGFTIEVNNTSPNAGRYTITDVGTPTVNNVTIDGTVAPFGFAVAITQQQFSVFRPGTQRLGSTMMSTNTTDASLYYFDVQLVSQGTGDLWNIAAGLSMSLSGYSSDGYYLTTTNPNTTFSAAEDITIHISHSIREVGVSDDPNNATQVSGQNLQINYAYSSLVAALQNFCVADTERVVNESPLGRHLVPHFVRFDLNYTGGSSEAVVMPLIQTYINELEPSDLLEASDLQNIVYGQGANYVMNPLDLVAVVYNFDRTVIVQRSADTLSTGRLSAFIPDVVNLTRKLTSPSS